MKPLSALPLALRPSFEEHVSPKGHVELFHCDVCCGPNTRANDLHDAVKALLAAGFETLVMGDTIYVKEARKQERKPTPPPTSNPRRVEVGFSPLGTGLENENDLF